jgi:plasmid replication initiation protein
MSNNVILYQSNAITESRYKFDLVEKRIIYFIIAEIRKRYIEQVKGQRDVFNDLIITIKGEQLRKADTNMKRVYASAMALRKKDIEINNDETWLTVGYINYVKHNKQTDTVEFGVSKQILPYLVELTAKFTSYQLAVAITLKSIYTQRFYELCSQWKSKGYFYMKLDKLRRILQCDEKFKAYGEFRRGVIDISQKELKEAYDQAICDLWFEYKTLEKEGKKVITLEFFVHTKENAEKPVYSITDYQFFIKNIMNAAYPKDKGFVDRVISATCNNFELAEQLAEKLSKKQKEYPGKELPAILRYILKEDFALI